MQINDFEKKKYEKIMNSFLDENRPPVHLRKELDISYKLEFPCIEIFEISPTWNNPEQLSKNPVAKIKYIRKSNIWKIYWMRADLKWHLYKPNSQVDTLEEFIEIVKKDEYGCFWG